MAVRTDEETMILRYAVVATLFLFAVVLTPAQDRKPSEPAAAFVVKTKQQVTDVFKELEKQDGNKQFDVFPAQGSQMRVAIFHDEKRENDLVEVHDDSDDIYYVLEGEATLMLGGQLLEPDEISPGEWRAKTATGGQKVAIRRGDLVVVPRGTPHQRTVTGKGFSMILIKIFREQQSPN